MSKKGRKWLRHMLYEKNPYCPECGVKMMEVNELPGCKDKQKAFPDNLCVVARRYTSYDKAERIHNKQPATIMCHKCYMSLDKERQDDIPLIERRMRSQRNKVIKHTLY